MDTIKDELKKLPAPDPTAPDRIWERYRESRETPSRIGWRVPFGMMVATAAAALVVFAAWPERARETVLESETVAWSEQVTLEADGLGTAAGRSRNIEIAWERGTVRAQVVPNSGTQLAVVTDEARVEVVGTVFSVTRDVLGVKTEVERGKVKVSCVDGWSGHVTPESGPRVCLPVRPGLLLGRADALLDQGAEPSVVLQTLDRGLASSPEDPVWGELMVRRMRARSDMGNPKGALADADAYLGRRAGTRTEEVLRFAAYLALREGCESGLPYLEPLEATGSAADQVLLAECVGATDPNRAHRLLTEALSAPLDPEWTTRAERALAALEVR